jgi:hypothetical protein
MGADCKSVAKASKVRILDLPPRAAKASDQRKRRSEAFFVGVGRVRLAMALDGRVRVSLGK